MRIYKEKEIGKPYKKRVKALSIFNSKNIFGESAFFSRTALTHVLAVRRLAAHRIKCSVLFSGGRRARQDEERREAKISLERT
jgi:hypothetical protein